MKREEKKSRNAIWIPERKVTDDTQNQVEGPKYNVFDTLERARERLISF